MQSLSVIWCLRVCHAGGDFQHNLLLLKTWLCIVHHSTAKADFGQGNTNASQLTVHTESNTCEEVPAACTWQGNLPKLSRIADLWHLRRLQLGQQLRDIDSGSHGFLKTGELI